MTEIASGVTYDKTTRNIAMEIVSQKKNHNTHPQRLKKVLAKYKKTARMNIIPIRK